MSPDPRPDGPTAENPWPVAELSRQIGGYIDRLGSVWIEGEITSWDVRAGNVYGKFKDLDVDASVSFNVWSSVRSKLDGDFQRGDRIVALVKPNYWVKGGSLSMNVLAIKRAGLGQLLEALQRLRATLAAEGLFDADRKRPLPFLPTGIGLVTGRESDAEKDVLTNARLRWPTVSFRVIHTAVQGDRAAAEVTAAITTLDADPAIDVIIVARGGGDFQNLLPFSDETLVRTVAACTTPVVSAIGHENDRPLLDDVADLRASTPTDAAKRVVPDVADERARVQQAAARARSRVTQLVAHEIDRLSQIRSRPSLASPAGIIDPRAEEVTRYVARGAELVHRRIADTRTQLDGLRASLRALSPQLTLERGYAIVQTGGGTVVRSPGDAPAGEALRITTADGRLGATSTGRET